MSNLFLTEPEYGAEVWPIPAQHRGNNREDYELRHDQEGHKAVELADRQRREHLRKVALRQRQDAERAHLQQQFRRAHDQHVGAVIRHRQNSYQGQYQYGARGQLPEPAPYELKQCLAKSVNAVDLLAQAGVLESLMRSTSS